MKKIQFQNATQTAPATVTINGVSHDVTPAVIEGDILPTPDNMNQLQNNVEEAILNPVVESIECKNKFDMNGNILESIGYTSGTNVLESGKIKSTANIANGNGKGQIIQLKPNTVYTYSVKISGFEVSGSTSLRISPVNSEGNAVGYLVDQNITCEVGKVYSYSFTTSDTGKIWVMLNGISNSDDYSILKYIVYEYIQIEEGSTATSYTSFKRYGYNSQESMGSIVVDDISCKNKFNISSVTWGRYAVTTDGTSIEEGEFANSFKGYVENIVAGETISISANYSTTFRFSYIFLDSSNNVLGGAYVSEAKISHVFNGLIVPANATKLLISQLDVAQGNDIKIQVEKGTVATNYSEYKGIGYVDTGWHDLTLADNVSNLDATQYITAQCRRINNFVQIEGMLKVTAWNTKSMTSIAFIPENYRPKKMLHLLANNNDVAKTMIVNPSGLIAVFDGANEWVSIHCSYMID